MNPEDLKDLLELGGELKKLNENLKSFGGDAKRLVSQLKTLNARFKQLGPLSKQIQILNQIMLQIGKTAGAQGVIQSLLESVIRMAR